MDEPKTRQEKKGRNKSKPNQVYSSKHIREKERMQEKTQTQNKNKNNKK
jgi:hypothetical protein